MATMYGMYSTASAALPGIKFKLSPKDNFYQEALDLLAGLDAATKQQQSELIKAVVDTHCSAQAGV
jgi:hypothetical protein